jgi:glutamate racemase
MDHEKPIGIFDSGIGGLTVARAVKDLLPNENIIYFGDTAHLPYGDKSAAAIQSYTVKICDLLIKQQCKVILIACNSASSAAYQLAKEYTGSKAKVINVIDPVIAYLGEKFENRTIGLIGTKRTVRSNVYQKKLDKLNRNIQLRSLATPLLAPMIEEGYFDNNISEQIIQSYLADPSLQGIEALVLGCTHYPLIKHQIQKFYDGSIDVIDSSYIVAENLKTYLDKNNLHKQSGTNFNKFFVSDYTHSFAEATRIFFREEVNLEFYPLWE